MFPAQRAAGPSHSAPRAASYNNMASTMVVPPSKHTLFMRGFTTRQNIDKIRDFFTREAGGCTVEFFKESENRERLFVALRFETKEIARDILHKYDQNDVLGDRISISWFKDLRRARQKAAQHSQFHRGGWDYQHGGHNQRGMHPDDSGASRASRSGGGGGGGGGGHRSLSPLRNGFRPGQYKSNYRGGGGGGDYGGPPMGGGGGWQRHGGGGMGRKNSGGGHRYDRRSWSRSLSRSPSSSRTYSSRSRSPRDSRSRGRSKSRSRSSSRSRGRSKSVDSRRSRSPLPTTSDKQLRDRDDSPDQSPRDRSSERNLSGGGGGGADKGRSRWEDPKNGDIFPPSQTSSSDHHRGGGGAGGGGGGGGAGSLNGHYDSYDPPGGGGGGGGGAASPPSPSHPRSRQVRSKVGAVIDSRGDEGYDQEGGEYGSLGGGGGPTLEEPPPSSRHHHSSGGGGPSPQQAQTPSQTAAASSGGQQQAHLAALSGHDTTPGGGGEYHRSRSRDQERYGDQLADVGQHDHTLHRSHSPSSDHSHHEQDHYDDRRRDRKRSFSGDARSGEGDADHRKSRHIDDDKVKKPMAKRTRGAETLDDEVDDRDTERGALGLPHDKMILVREKKEEIEKAYRQDCETFAAVVKMLVSKDAELESKLQQSLRENLKEIGQRCIQELREFINKVKVEEHA